MSSDRDAITNLVKRWQDRAHQLRRWSPASAATYELAAEELSQLLREPERPAA